MRIGMTSNEIVMFDESQLNDKQPRDDYREFLCCVSYLLVKSLHEVSIVILELITILSLRLSRL